LETRVKQDPTQKTDTDQSTERRFRQLKWLVIALTFAAITIGEVWRYLQGGSAVAHVFIWLIGISAAYVLIEISFRKVSAIQRELDDVAIESRALERQQMTLVNLSEKLASVTSYEEICQIIGRELQTYLGNEYQVACLMDERMVDSQLNLEAQFAASANNSGGPDQTESLLAAAKGQIPPASALDAQTPNGNRAQTTAVPELVTNIEVPMQVGDKAIGRLIVSSVSPRTFTGDEQALISGIANQGALAIENVRLIEQRKQYQADAERRETELHVRERYLTLLSEITRTTLIAQDFQAMLQTLTEYLGKLLEADSALILLWDEARKQSIPSAAYGPLRQVYRTIQIEPDELTLISSVLNSGRVLEIKNTTSSPYISARIATQFQIKSLLALPLIADNQKLGVALLSNRSEHGYSQREVSLGEQASSQLALAIAKWRALDAAQHRTQELTALQKATAALLTTLDLEVLLGQILDAAISAISAAEKGTLHLVARDTGQLQLRAIQGYTDPRIRTFNPTDSASFAATSVRERRPLLVHDAHADPQTRYGGDIPEIRAISSMIIAPLILGGRTLGAISLDAYRRYAFTEADLQLLVSFAATATTAINNAQLYTEVQRQAITDPLTSLYNRRGFFELGRREVERAHRFSRPLTAMMIDIDLFKKVNDSQGHLIGDQVLAGVASQIIHQLRQVDLPGRYGGDEFIALLPETDLSNAHQAAERLRKAIEQNPYPTENEPVQISVSIGLAELKHTIDTLETLIERADQALYTAKQSGRNRTIMEDRK